MARHKESGDDPWHLTPGATFAAGGVGVALLVALVVGVVQMSDEWSQPQTTLLTTPATTQPAPTTRDREAFIITPSTTTTTFATSVLSTTEFIDPAATLPGTETTTGSPTTPTTSGSPTSPTTSASPTTTTGSASRTDSARTESPTTQYPVAPGETTSTTQRGPRYNITRTLGPSY